MLNLYRLLFTPAVISLLVANRVARAYSRAIFFRLGIETFSAVSRQYSFEAATPLMA
jgi:hypothetical protein